LGVEEELGKVCQWQLRHTKCKFVQLLSSCCSDLGDLLPLLLKGLLPPTIMAYCFQKCEPEKLAGSEREPDLFNTQLLPR
jgi:hypothetical protein